MKNVFEILIKYLRKVNKYGITVIIFVFITLFVGDSTIWKRMAYDREIKQLESNIESLTKEKESNLEKLDAINSSAESLETFAREQFLMTKPNEELFIIRE